MRFSNLRTGFHRGLLVVVLACGVLLPNLVLPAAAQSGRPAPQKKNPTLPDEGKPAAEPPQEEKSPGKGSLSNPQRKPPLKKTEQEDTGGDAIKIETSLVSLEAVVYNKKTGQIYQNLKKDNFILYEDGVKQEITNFRPTQSPITLVILVEFSKITARFTQIGLDFSLEEVIAPVATFVQRFARPEDYISIVAYDIRPKVLNDFTGDGRELYSSISLLARNRPAFSESNLFDALKFVIQGGKLDGEEFVGMQEVSGKTAILLVSTGFDTFSRINYDQARKIVEGAGIPVYGIGIGNLFYKMYESRMPPEMNLTFLQAANTLKTFSDSSGGKFYPVTFIGELNSTLAAINAMMRSQFSLGYSPTNASRQGKRRKIELQVDLDGDGKPEGKEIEIQYRKSYIEPGGKK